MISTGTALGFWSFDCRSACVQLFMVGFISALLLIGLNKSTLGQNSDLIFNNLSLTDGLSHTTVHQVIQDRQGLVWISTRDKLIVLSVFGIKDHHVVSDRNKLHQ